MCTACMPKCPPKLSFRSLRRRGMVTLGKLDAGCFLGFAPAEYRAELYDFTSADPASGRHSTPIFGITRFCGTRSWVFLRWKILSPFSPHLGCRVKLMRVARTRSWRWQSRGWQEFEARAHPPMWLKSSSRCSTILPRCWMLYIAPQILWCTATTNSRTWVSTPASAPLFSIGRTPRAGPGVLDLGYFLALNGKWLAFENQAVLELYTKSLAAYGHILTTKDVDLGLLAGGALRLLWLMVLNDQNDLEWWYDLIRRVGAQIKSA